MDYLNSASVADLAGTAYGELLIGPGDIQAKLTAAHMRLLRRFDAAHVHDADGYGSSSAWLAAKAGMSKKAARAVVRQMGQLADRLLLDTALAAGDITDSWPSGSPTGPTSSQRRCVRRPTASCCRRQRPARR